MLFNSIYFLFFFAPVFFTVYFLLPGKYKNAFILLGSIFFYAWGAPKFVFVLLIAVVCDFFFAQQIHKTEGNLRKYWLAGAISLNAGILLYFKYANFFVTNFCGVFGCNSQGFAQILLPIGISFFTFHEISYLFDVYRKTKEPFKSIVNYAVYIFLFPQLIAGPIIRFHEIADQIENRNYNNTDDNRLLGFFRFAIGLAKKVLIADVLGAEVTRIFSLQQDPPDIVTAWIGAFMNLLNIYIDFSAYSDMAIGLGLVMGFRFPENFNHPLTAQSITKFWQRWHMSLYRWMREYLYIPLGGSRKGEMRTCVNILLVFLFTGFWHGASWTFVVWGIGNGLLIVAERLFLNRILSRAGTLLRIVYTLVVMVCLLVIFSHHSLDEAFSFLRLMFTCSGPSYPLYFSLKTQLALAVSLIIAFGALWPGAEAFVVRIFEPYRNDRYYLYGVAVSVVLVVISSCMLMVTGYNPFLYFKF